MNTVPPRNFSELAQTIRQDEIEALAMAKSLLGPHGPIPGAGVVDPVRTGEEAGRNDGDRSMLPFMPIPGRYQLGEVLGSGGGGTVYLAHDRALGRDVAVKFGRVPAHSGNKELFRREFLILAKLQHPCIPPILDAGQDEHANPWFSMPCARLGSLADMMSSGKTKVRDMAWLVDVMLRVAEALAYAHSKGIVHLDVKPGNILLGDYGEVWLVDWGSAQELVEGHCVAVGGTPLYMAPEQARNEMVDQRTDMFSFAASLWQLVVGRSPTLTEDGLDAFLDARRAGHIDPLNAEEASRLPPALMQILLRSLSPDRLDRYPDMSSFALALSAWRSEAGLWHSAWSMRPDVSPRSGPLAPGVADLPSDTGRLMPDQTYRIPTMVAGGIRIECDARWPSHIDGLDIMIVPLGTKQEEGWPAGIIVHVGGWGGYRTLVAINDVPGLLSIREECAPLLEAGRVHRIVAEASGGRLVLWVDGVQIAMAEDLLAPERSGSKEVQLRSWNVPVDITGLRIHQLGSGGNCSPLAVADALLSAGLTDAAMAQYRLAAATHAGMAIGDLAIARMLRLAYQSGEAVAIDPELQKAGEGLPQAQRREIDELRILKDWRSGRCMEAVEQAVSHMAIDPDSHLPVRLMHDGRPRSPSCLSRFMGMLGMSPNLKGVELTNWGVDDLAPLQSLRLQSARISGNLIQDLTPLKGHPLCVLHLDFNPVIDLSPLRTAPLRDVSLAWTQVNDIRPVLSPQLRSLCLDHAFEVDLTPIQGTAVEQLRLCGVPIPDATILDGLPLSSLELDDSRIARIPTNPHGRWREIVARGTSILDLSPLAEARQLQRCDLNRTAISNIDPLRGAVSLAELVIRGTLVRDLSPLAGLPLATLDVGETEISSLIEISTRMLSVVHIDHTRVIRVPELAVQPLRHLNIAHTAICELRTLRGKRIETLDASECRALDISAGMPEITRSADLRGTPWDDPADVISALGSDLESLAIDGDDRRMELLEMSLLAEKRGHLARQVRIQRLLAHGGAADLRRFATRQGAVLRLAMPGLISHGTARTWASRLGARLAAPGIAGLGQLEELVSGRRQPIWLGAQRAVDGSIQWENGMRTPPRGMGDDRGGSSTLRSIRWMGVRIINGLPDPVACSARARCVLEWDA